MGNEVNDAIIGGIFTGFGFIADAIGVVFAESPWSVILIGVLVLAGLILPSRRTRRRR